MKLFKFFSSQAGKAVLSATQAIAASAAVGLGGIAAWQFLSSSSPSDTAYNSLGYQPQEEIVYVSSASTGKYGRGESTESSFRAAPSKAIEMQQQEAEYLRQQEQAREEAERAAYEANLSTPSVQANSFGGLNEGLGNKKLEAMTPEEIKALQAQTMQQAQDAIAAGKAQADAIAAAAASGVNGAASRGGLGAAAGASGRSGSMMAGTGLSSSGSVQYVGMPGGAGSSSGSEGIASGTDAVYLPGQEGARIPTARNQRAKPSFGANVNRIQGSQEFNSLEMIAKRSAEIAGNETRSANEAGRAFLASTKNSGGIRLDGIGEVSVGQGASSDDFGDASLSGIHGAVNGAMDELLTAEEEFKEQRKNLRRQLRQLIGATIGVCFLPPFLSWRAVKRKFNKYFADAASYNAEYGDRSKEAKAGEKIAKKLRICAKAGAFGGLALFVAMIPWMLADAFGWTTSVDELRHDDGSADDTRVGTVSGGGAGVNEPGSTLDVQEGRSASNMSRQEMQSQISGSDAAK